MRALLVAVMLGVITCQPLTASAQTKAAPAVVQNTKAETAASAAAPWKFRREAALLGGGALGLLLASGAVNLIAAGTMIYDGVAITEALEAGAGLTMPLAVLSTTLGVVFGQDLVLRAFGSGETKPAGH